MVRRTTVTRPKLSPANGATQTMQLRSGGNVTLSYSVDLFDVDDSDQVFLLELIRRFKEYSQDDSAESVHARSDEQTA